MSEDGKQNENSLTVEDSAQPANDPASMPEEEAVAAEEGISPLHPNPATFPKVTK